MARPSGCSPHIINPGPSELNLSFRSTKCQGYLKALFSTSVGLISSVLRVCVVMVVMVVGGCKCKCSSAPETISRCGVNSYGILNVIKLDNIDFNVFFIVFV